MLVEEFKGATLKDIVIVAEFCGDFSHSDNNRFFYIAKMLAANNQVELITSQFLHTSKKQRKSATEDFKNFKFKLTFIHEPGYLKNICIKRLYSHYIWGRNVAEYLKNRKKPDVLYCAVPPLTSAKKAALYANRYNVRFIIDVQDLWPEAFSMAFHIPVISRIAFLPFRILADDIYRRADGVCAVSKTYVDRAMKVNRKCKKGTVVYLGTDLTDFDRYAAENCVEEIKNLPEKKGMWLAYCGSLSDSYDIKTVIDALTKLKSTGKNVPTFLIMGDGSRKEEFQEYAKRRSCDVVFLGRLPYSQMCKVLRRCDMAVNPIAANSAASIINKHGDYAASGLPVLNMQENGEYMHLIEKYQMGFNCDSKDADTLAKNIDVLMKDSILRKKMGNHARKCAIERFNRKETFTKITKIVCGGGKIKKYRINSTSPIRKVKSEFWIGYCGTLGTSYDLSCVIDALAFLDHVDTVPVAANKPKADKIQLVIIGDGPQMAEHIQYAALKNVHATFLGRLPYDQMCGILSACDVLVNPIRKGAPQSIINKHADYVACGLPIISTQEKGEFSKLLEVYGMGIHVNNVQEFAEAIIKLYMNAGMRKRMGERARSCASDWFDRSSSYRKIYELMNHGL